MPTSDSRGLVCMAETRETKSDESRRLKDNVNGSRDWSMKIVLDNVDMFKSKR